MKLTRVKMNISLNSNTGIRQILQHSIADILSATPLRR